MANMDPELLKDMESEKAFLVAVSKFELGEVEDNPVGVANELSLLVRVYNEQLERLVRLRIDAEIQNHLVLAEPMEKVHLDNKGKTVRALKVGRKAVSIIRGQIEGLAKGGGRG